MRAFEMLLRRGAVEAFLLFAAFLAGMTAWVFVAFREESTWDNYMSSHGGMSPPPDFVANHQLSAYTHAGAAVDACPSCPALSVSTSALRAGVTRKDSRPRAGTQR
jgi:hypothetical protein